MPRRSTRARGRNIPAVVIPLTTQHYTMLARNLLYTGVTRGKRLVVLVGQTQGAGDRREEPGSRRRWSKLREWLTPGATLSSQAAVTGGTSTSTGTIPRCG